MLLSHLKSLTNIAQSHINALPTKNCSYVNADYSSYCDTIVDLYMQAYELIRSV